MNEERCMAHKLAEEQKLFHRTTGTRYRRLTISVHPFEKTITTNRQIAARELRSAAAMTIPNDAHVSAVVNAPTKTKRTGRPKKQK